MKNNPYIGPRSFEENDIKLFFGREEEIRDMVSLIISHRVFLLYGLSGTGKTSIFNAGVYPRLKKDFKTLRMARVSGNKEKSAVSNLLNNLAGKEVPEKTISQFMKNKEVYDIVPPCLIVLDQFEELFKFYKIQDKEKFFHQLKEAIDNNPSLWVLIILREEYLADFNEYNYLFSYRLYDCYHLNYLNSNAAKDAIEKPCGPDSPYTAEAIEELKDELLKIRNDGDYIEPIYLQIVCQYLWDRLPSRTQRITKKHVKSFGKIADALKNFCEQVISETASEYNFPEDKLYHWINDELIDNENRKFIRLGNGVTKGMNTKIVRELENKHLIHSLKLGGDNLYELNHELLIKPIKEFVDINNYLFLVHLNFINGSYDEANKNYEKVIQRGTLSQEIEAYLAIAEINERLSKYPESIENCQNADKSTKNLHNKFEEQKFKIRILNRFGNIYRMQGNCKEALTKFNDANEIIGKYPGTEKDLGEIPGEIRQGKGSTHYFLGEYADADICFEEAWEFLKNNEQALAIITIWKGVVILGRSLEKSKPDKSKLYEAYKLLDSAYNKCNELGSDFGTQWSMHEKAYASQLLGNEEEAFELFHKSLQTKMRKKTCLLSVSILGRFGSFLSNYQKDEKRTNQVKELLRKMSDIPIIQEILSKDNINRFKEIPSQATNKEIARLMLETANIMAEKCGAQYHYCRSLIATSKLYADMEDKSKAEEYLKEANKLCDKYDYAGLKRESEKIQEKINAMRT